jgi:SAM-dependent methyltransferase
VEYVRHPVGLDYAPNLLAIARQRLEGRAALAHADMRAVPFQPAFDAVTNFFTSFGYFMSGEENAQVAREIARVLRPRGRFLVDHVNKEHVTRNLAPETTRQAGGYDVLERRWIDGDPPRINKRTFVSRQGQSAATLHESVQLYEPEELRMLLNEAGLVVEAMYGAYDGAPLSSRADRMILVGRRE